MEPFNENESAIFPEDHKINNIPLEIPDDTLMEKIILQVEYLFSDANILKDKFLLKHIRRNKEGHVSLKLISSLRKVKALTKDWRVVAYCLQKSQKLQMNEEKTKIRRLEPLTRGSGLESSRDQDYTVLLFHTIPGYWTYENVNRLQSEFRSVKSIVMINSRTELVDLDIQRTLDFYANIATFPFAVVKFDAPSEAANVILRTSYATSPIKVVPLVHGNHSTEYESPTVGSSKGKEHDCPNHSEISSDPRRSEHQKFYLDDSYSGINEDYRCDRDKKHNQVLKESLNAFEGKEKTYLTCTFRGDGPDNNRWTRKKFFNGYLSGPCVIILRQPKGPDGTKGFRAARIITSNSVCYYR